MTDDTGFRSEGRALQLTAPENGVVVGVPVLIGNILVIPNKTADEGETFVGDTSGVWEVPKFAGDAAETDQVWAQGEAIYWDAAESKFTKTAANNERVGIATENAAQEDETGTVRLNGIAIDTA